MDNIQNLVNGLVNSDDKQAYICLKKLENESYKSPIIYPFFDVFAAMINSENSYVRTRGIILISANAQWDIDYKIDELLYEYLKHLANPTKYKESMQPLVLKDIQKSLKDIEKL